MLAMVLFFIAFRWIHLSTPLLRRLLLVLRLLLMPTLNRSEERRVAKQPTGPARSDARRYCPASPPATARKTAEAPLAAAELTALTLRDGADAAYVSLGVAEHDPSGPDAILAEGRRVLAPGGALVVSTPYVNGIRRLATPYLRCWPRSGATASRPGRCIPTTPPAWS